MKRIGLFILRAAFTTLLAGLMSKTIIYDFTSASLFAPIEKATDFQLSDFYNTTADMRPVRDLSSSIVIIGIDGMSRHQIAELLNFINMYFPRVIGLDVLFAYGNADSILLNAIQQTSNIVLAKDAANVSGTIDPSLVTSATWGAINLAATDMRDVIRTYQPYVITQNNDTIPSFAQALADAYLGKHTPPDLEEKYIYFPSQAFEHYSGAAILDGSYTDEQLVSILEDRLVLISDIQNPFDRHVVPLSNLMSGCELHAHILNTILSEHPVRETPTTISWIIAVLIALAVSLLNLGFVQNRYFSELSGCVMRVVQFGCIVLFLYIGCFCFIQNRVYLKFAPSLLMISFTVLAGDIEPVFFLSGKWMSYWLKKLKSAHQELVTEPALQQVANACAEQERAAAPATQRVEKEAGLRDALPKKIFRAKSKKHKKHKHK